nr:MAG TPA: hypothetical protein [Caudoviricetes sp.]DAY33249.1 MAG TPA: hypothetical protein [Caudoviricetes sp.]
MCNRKKCFYINVYRYFLYKSYTSYIYFLKEYIVSIKTLIIQHSDILF